ncbi:transcription factor bHLH104-like [Punica granatum]|uniref:Transcription factor bHLH104-like n=1 Tax=Punica granatum TaxID=22663 RepID=A0A6P8DG21_PUNGR|nr:transcription factor bHLH104-like [Punica granatum]
MEDYKSEIENWDLSLMEEFLDLSAVLEPGRSCKTEKPAILDDAIRVLTQLKSESLELKETNEKLLEEIKCLKVEKNELREEKLTLKADKERMEQQLKTMSIPPAGFVPTHLAAYHHPVVNKMAVYPSYGLIPMWQYMPPSARDTSSDHELRPPAA